MISKRATIITLVLALCFLTASAPAQTGFKLKQILKTGDSAPVPRQLSAVGEFSLNDSAQVAFIGDGGLFLKSGSTVQLLVGFGDAAPGGGTFIQISTPSMNSKGQIIFTGVVTSPSTSGIFLYSQGTITEPVADFAISTTGDLIFPTLPVINDAGVIAFLNNGIPGFPFFAQGVFTAANGAITKIAVDGDLAPGNGTFTGFNPPAMNNSGQLVFQASLQETLPNPFVPTDGLFLASGGAITKIIDSGDTFPDGSTFFDVIGDPSINDSGQVAFAGLVDGFATDDGVYLYSGGSLKVVVPAFTPISGLTFSIIENAAINNAGEIAFESQLLFGNGGTGVFLFTNNVVSTVMLPSTSSPDGDTFSSRGAFGLAINGPGQVLFASRLLEHTDALYLSTANQLSRVAGQGDSVNREPKFEFPFAFGISNHDQVLVFDSTFPGGIGLYTADRTPLGRITLDAHISQSVGNDGVIDDIPENFSMNGNGQVLLNSDFSSGISSMLLKSGSSLNEIVRGSFSGNGDPAPGGGTFLGMRESSINNLGQILFSGFSTTHAGLYLSSNGQIALAVDDNAELPDGTATFGTISLNALNDNGDIAFLAQSFPVPNGMYLLSHGQFTTLARDGAPAPGGGSFSLLFPDPRYGPVVSDNGSVAFAADLSIGGRGIFLFSQGSLTRIVGPGDSSPDGSIFFTADAPTINSSGQIAFSAETGNGFGVFLYSAGTVRKISIPGDQLPGRLIVEFADLPQINDLGHVGFAADLSNGITAVFVARPIEEDGQDSTEMTAVSGPPDPFTPRSLAQAKARHPENFTRRKSKLGSQH